jgi:hypothetical protein
LGAKASINPIRDPGEAQKLLENAYFCSDQAFNIRFAKDLRGKIDKQIIRFHYEGQGIWHCYELRLNFQKIIGKNGIMDIFRKDALITDADYGDLVTNKWKK